MTKSIADLQKLVEDHEQAVTRLQEQSDREERLRNEQNLKALGINPAIAHIDQQLSQEILTAINESTFPKARLQQLAKSHGIRWETVEGMANEVCFRTKGIDLESIEFSAMVDRVKYLEEQIEDAGLRQWKLQSLARRYGRSCTQVMEAFSKALINNAPVEPMTLRQLKEQNGEDIEWLFPGWIIKGTTVLLHAMGGTGKTLFAYDMAEALIKGKVWQGYPTEKRKVMIVQLDEPPYATIERLEIRGIPQDEIQILGNWQAEHLPRLAAYIEREQPDFVIIDSLTAINRNCCFKENDVEYARPLLHLADLAARTGTTFLIIHHSSVDGRARGSTAIHNSVSEVWNLSHHNQALRELKLTVEKTRLGRPPGKYKFTFHPENYSFTYDGELNGDVLAEDDTPQQEKIRLWLSEDCRRTNGFHPKEIAEALQMNEASCRRACREAFNRRLISRKRCTSGRGYSYFVGAPQLPLGYQDHEEIPTVTRKRSGVTPVISSPIGDGSLAETQSQHGTGELRDQKIKLPPDLNIVENSQQHDLLISRSANPLPSQEQSQRSCTDLAPIGTDHPIANLPLNDRKASVNEKSNCHKAKQFQPLKVGERVQLSSSAYEGYQGSKTAKPLAKSDLESRWTLFKSGPKVCRLTRAHAGHTREIKVPSDWVQRYQP